MRNLIFILLIFAFGCRKIHKTKAIVIRDCTGVFARFDGLDHPVCNSTDISTIETGSEVEITYKVNPKKCEAKSYPVCCVVHDYPYGEWIKLTDIQIK